MKSTYLLSLFNFLSVFAAVGAEPQLQQPLNSNGLKSSSSDEPGRRVSAQLFWSLEELSRLADIAYCVGSTGIRKPFSCSNHCDDFRGFELVTSWHTGPLLSDSCGYIALSHVPGQNRIVIAFRGSYSITNAIVDLSAVPQVYVPYPGAGDEPSEKCDNCTVHAGFMASWENAKEKILPHLSSLVADYPDYELVLVGHSLGGAVAALAALELQARGWAPQVTTFGEPRVGNEALAHFIDSRFKPDPDSGYSKNDSWLKGRERDNTYRRVTHVNDPVPLLPMKGSGYEMHGGEIFISKPNLPPSISDLEHCEGDSDWKCIASEESAAIVMKLRNHVRSQAGESQEFSTNSLLSLPSLKFWELLFSHRDYFSRLGLCIPGMRGS
ncbi:hypothetical protein FQN54_000690 [Arachnomyces sp. PD_36]|nr:hypothetical protein FQN54_000690 [Arachnomyces sp. PD_36]